MLGQLIFDILCDILCWFWVAPIDWFGKEKGKPAETQFVSINNNCSIDGCNAMRYEESEYCLRHEAFPTKESKEETQQEENWWSDEKA